MATKCVIKIDFEDGATGVHMGGTTPDLIAGSISIVNSMYQSLKDAKGGEFACLMFKAVLDSGAWLLSESDFEQEHLDTPEELDAKMAAYKKAKKARGHLADIVELLMKDSERKEGEQNG